ncbi:MAG: exo-alpha-sialidase, partial [Lysobacteraceae bacterium]
MTRLSALGILATLAPLATSTVAQAQTQLSADDAIYARARQLSNGEVLASVVAFTGG